MKLISWNVNGIRANINKGFFDFLQDQAPDVIGLQEIKAKEHQIEAEVQKMEELGYHVYLYPAERPGYSGTAILSKTKPLSVSYGMDMPEHDTEGRVLTAEYEDFFFVTVYTPNAKPDLSRLDYRQDWDKLFFDFCKELEIQKPVILCGDLNVAYKEIDLARPKPNRGKAGFTDEERSGIQYGFDKGFIDTLRLKYPDTPELYTWWSYYGWARARNVGWRIDYFLCSPDLENNIETAFILPEVMGSDHCPVGITI